MWSDLQLHVSPVARVMIDRVAPVENRQDVKPKYGFWTSTYTGQSSAWVDWCQAEQFGDVLAGSWFLLRPKPKARVFVIDSLADLHTLLAGYTEPDTAYYGYGRACIDFERLALDYDGLHLTEEGEAATRFARPGLYGWDCESTLWFRWCFKSCELVPAPYPPSTP